MTRLAISPRDLWTIFRSQHASPAALRSLQGERLRRVIANAAVHVPYYRELFRTNRIDPRSIVSAEDLHRIPITTKRDLVAAGEDAISNELDRQDLIARRTTGSSGEPATLWFDRRFERIRSLMFLRALLAIGYRPGDRLLMMKSRRDEAPRPWMRWDVASFEESPERIIEHIGRTRTSILYGWVTPLRQIAEHVLQTGARIGTLKAVVSTAEGLDAATRRLLQDAFRAPVFDFYGLTEMGTVAWECRHHDGYHVSEDNVLLELAAAGRGSDEQSMILTNLSLMSMPLIRYQSGDMAVVDERHACACGRTFRRLRRISGREVDCLRLPGGRLVSPYTVTLALEPVAGLRRYQVVQHSPHELLVRCEGSPSADAVRSALAAVAGPDTKIDVRVATRIDVPAGRKFRVVESRVPVEP